MPWSAPDPDDDDIAALGDPERPLSSPAASARTPSLSSPSSTSDEPVSRPWYRGKRFTVPLALLAGVAVVALLVGVGALLSRPSTTVASPAKSTHTTKTPAPRKSATLTPSSQPSPAKTEPSAGIGEPATAGHWTFRVTKIKCGVKKVGATYLTAKPQGQFCLLSLAATNNGSKAAALLSNRQTVLDADDREFKANAQASILNDPRSPLLVEQVNPGNTARGVLVFDLPKKTQPTKAVLSGGLLSLSGPATVSLR